MSTFTFTSFYVRIYVMINPVGPNRDPGSESFKDLYPYPEDWVALQGGKPRVFRNPRRPGSVWLVIHVYEEHEDTKLRFQSGIEVPTIPPEGDIHMSRLTITRTDYEGTVIQRDIKIPSFMHRVVHGQPCDTQSAHQGGGAYEKIPDQENYEEYLANLRQRGFEELRFGINSEGFTLTPLPEIKSPKPLK